MIDPADNLRELVADLEAQVEQLGAQLTIERARTTDAVLELDEARDVAQLAEEDRNRDRGKLLMRDEELRLACEEVEKLQGELANERRWLALEKDDRDDWRAIADRLYTALCEGGDISDGEEVNIGEALGRDNEGTEGGG